jgi:hypothetical protein
LFAVRVVLVQASMVSRPTASVQVLMVSAPMGSVKTEQTASSLEALGSAPVGLPEPDLERLQAAKR